MGSVFRAADRRLRVFVLAAVAALTAVACRSRGATSLRDSEGRSFDVRCGEGGPGCTLTQTGGPKARAGTRPVLRAKGRLVGVCDASGDADSVHPADCRPLVCQSDGDCPALHAGSEGACIGATCVEPANPIGADDAVMRCLAGTGLGHDAPKQVERYALGLNCGSPCEIPAPCRPRSD